jgi:spermidine synthase
VSRARSVLVLAALGGAGTMVVELAAVRLLAPWFGTSLVVWTNVIGVILLALALGYLAGARWSRAREPLAGLSTALLAAGAVTALLPFCTGPAAGLFLPGALALDEALPLVAWGSLATALLLFLVPAALLGAVAPLSVEAVGRLSGRGAGDAGGRVLAASTLGSLAGVFGTTHVLVPRLGLAGTFFAAAGVLALAGALGLVLARRRAPLLALALIPAALALAGPEVARAAPPGWEVLARRESLYQSLRVSEDRRAEVPMRQLQVNEAFDSFQSVWRPEPGFLPEGYYYNYFALPLLWSAPRGPFRVLVLGLGAGTAWRVLEGSAPAEVELHLEGVELDPEVLALARDYMELPPDGARHRAVGGVDARVALRGERAPLDLVVLDCYANQVEIPFHLATVEFLREVRSALAPGGWLALNAGGFAFDDPLVAALAATVAEAFEGEALVVRVPASRNFVIYGRRGAALPVEGGRLAAVGGQAQELLLVPLAVPGGFITVERGGGRVLTDDDAPLEELQLASIRAAQRRLRKGAP